MEQPMLSQNEIVQKVIGFLNDNKKFLKIETSKKIDSDTHVFGENGLLDSIGLVHLIVNLEKQIKNETGKKIVLVSSDAMSKTKSPFKSVSTIAQLIKDKL